MPFEITMPHMGQTTAELEIVRWLKKEGEYVKAGEPILEVMTDKARVEVESWAEGTVQSILFPEGEKVEAGTVIALIAGPEEMAAPAAAESQAKLKVSPRARKLAAEHGIDLRTLKGSGTDGAIIERDVLAAIVPPEFKATPTKEDVLRAEKEEAITLVPSPTQPGRLMPLTAMRRAIAERMVQSKQTIPHFYVYVDVDMSEVMRLRQALNPALVRKGRIELSPTDFLIRAVASALVEFPQVNVRWEEGILWLEEINIGLAVALEEGLIVPVLRRVERKSLLEIAKMRKDLVERAHTGRLRAEELTDSTFTISNMGIYGIDGFLAIINPPESAILAVGQIAERATVADGQLAIRPMVTLTLSVDHRLLDGATAATFLHRIKEILESPETMLIE
ncbi:MAG: dihydrolipoamide acetyltransferase family protein [Anaerolineae bacterium]